MEKIKKNILRSFSLLVKFIPEESLVYLYQKISKIKLFKILINKIILLFIPEKVKIMDLYLFLNPKDSIVSGSIAMDIYESFETKIFCEKLSEGMIVVDIGANIGYYTLIAAQKAKEVFAFEPDSDNLFFLEKNLKENNLGNVRIYQKAISNKTDLLKFYKNPYNYGDSRVYSFNEGLNAKEVEAISLDEFNVTNNLKKIDIIKMDIQGAEGLALEGMKQTLHIDGLKLFIEFFPKGLRTCNTDPKNFIETLFSNNFFVWHINSNTKTLDQIENADVFVSKFKDVEYCNLYCEK